MTLGQRNQVMESFVRALGSYHAEHPLRRAMPRGELRSRLQESLGRAVDVRLFNALAETAAAGGIVSADENGMWLPGHAVRLTSDQQQRMERTLQTLADAGYAPPNAQDVLQMLGGDERLMEMLVEQDRLVPLGGGVIYRREEFEAMLAGIRGYIAEHGSMTLAEARDHFGVSRRYVQALLEEADARRITRREGDTRVLR